MNIYFDETNHSRKISVSKEGDKITYDSKRENWFYYVFLGVNDETFISKKFVELEQKYFNNVESQGEIKSSRILKNLSYFYELNDNKKSFYIDLLELLINNKAFFQLGSINKINEFIELWSINVFQKLVNRINSPVIDYKIFVIFFSKFISNNCQFQFLSMASKNKSLRKQLIFIRDRVSEKIEILKKLKIFDMVEIFESHIYALREIIKVCSYKESFEFTFVWSYDYIRTGLEKLISETNTSIEGIIVDSEETIREMLSKKFKNVTCASSHNTPILRICDHLVGLFRAVGNVVNKNHRQTSEITMSFKKITRYDEKIFTADDRTKEMLSLLYNFLNESIYWETFTNLYSDEIMTIVSYIQLMAEPKIVDSESLNTLVTSRMKDFYYS